MTFRREVFYHQVVKRPVGQATHCRKGYLTRQIKFIPNSSGYLPQARVLPLFCPAFPVAEGGKVSAFSPNGTGAITGKSRTVADRENPAITPVVHTFAQAPWFGLMPTQTAV